MRQVALKKFILKEGISARKLAELTGIGRISLCAKLWGIVEFRAWEIVKISAVLALDKKQVEKIFFEEKVS